MRACISLREGTVMSSKAKQSIDNRARLQMDCFVALLLAMTERATATRLSITRIGNHVARHPPVPDEQNHPRADRRGDEAYALIRTVMADGLADKGREKRAGDAQHRGQEESAGIVRSRRKQPGDDAGDEADDDDPENAAHGCRPLSRKRLLPVRAGLPIRFRTASAHPASSG